MPSLFENGYKEMMQTIFKPVLVMDSTLRVIYANRSFLDCFYSTHQETVGRHIYNISGHMWDIPEVRTLLEEELLLRHSIMGYHMEHDFSRLGRSIIRLNAHSIEVAEVSSRIVLLEIMDITKKSSPLDESAGPETAREEATPEVNEAGVQEDDVREISDYLLLSMILDNSLDAVYFKDRDLRFVYANRKSAFNRNIENPFDVIGKSDFDFLRENNAKIGLKDDREILETGKPIIEKIEKLTMLSGAKKWISVSKYPFYDDNGSITGIWGISRDVTENELAKETLHASESRYETMIANIADVIAIVQFGGTLRFISPNVEKWFGWSVHDIIGTQVWDRIHPKDADAVKNRFFDLIGEEGLSDAGEFRFQCRDGSYKYVEMTAVNMVSDPNINGILINYHDISQRKEEEAKIVYLSYHDVLTGLYNRAFFEEELKRLDTTRQLPLSIIIGDINGLKLINDGFGHAEGDRMIVEVARILVKCCRREDIIARISGDEFCILLPQTGPEIAQTVCRRVYEACGEHENKKDKETHFASISLGYAAKTSPEEPVDGVLKSAEEIMYRHKLLERKSMHSSIISSIKTTMFEKSHETEEHAERLVALSRSLGQSLGLTDGQLYDLDLLSTLHDIGKMSIDDRILSKREKLTEKEWLEIKRHPQVGYRIAMASPDLISIADYILCHHERWDGSGYPQGLSGETIPLLSRIIAVTDAYDAMTNDRPYRRAMTEKAAMDEIIRCAGTQFDPEITRVFINMVKLGQQKLRTARKT